MAALRLADTRVPRYFVVRLPPMRLRTRRLLPPLLLSASALCAATPACVRETIPDPRQTLQRWSDAAARGDADALYDMLDERGRRELSREEVRRMVADQRKELADQARSLQTRDVEIRATAEVRYADGETSVLELQDGQLKIASADALPAGAKTPAQALEQLRRVLARRSYAGLTRVLTQQTRGSLENDLRSLVEGLENPEELDVDQVGETATVRVPGGHLVRLRREAGTWRVEDIN